VRQLKSILAFLFVLLPVLAYGQVTQLSGPVKNNANAAVPNATVTFVLTNCGSSAPTNPVDVAITTSGGYINAEIPRNHSFKCIGTDYYQVTLTDASGNLIWTRPYMFTTQAGNLNSPLTTLPPAVPGLSSGNGAILDAKQIGGVYQVDQFSGSDIGVKIANCLSGLNQTYGGTCDARNFVGTLSMASNLTISTTNAVIYLPCATISTASQIIVLAAVRNVVLHGCSLRGISTASGSQGGTVLLYSGPSNAVQVGDTTYAQNTMGFKMDNVAINTTGSTSAATGFYAYRAQELRLESSYFLGNQNQTGMTIDGTGNYAGGTFEDLEFTGFGQAINGTGHLISNAATTDWMNASTFIRVHIDCPESNGNPITGIYGINLQAGDGNTFIGGDVEGCGTMFHLGSHAQNNTILGLRNEVSAIQYQADSGSQFNSVITGGTFFTGDLIDNGSRNNFEDAFHRASNGMKGDWYASQQDVTIEDHQRLGIGVGNERGRLTEVQTDYGYRWIYGLGDGTSGMQMYYVQDLLNSVYRLSIGQYLSANGNSVVGVSLNNGGTYTSSTPPTITFSGGGGTGAAGTAVMYGSGTSWYVLSVTMTNNGSGYTSAPTVTFTGPNQTKAPNAVAEITLSGSTNNQTVLNAAGTGAIVLNGSNNSGTGGVIFGSGGPSETTVGLIDGHGNATFQGTLTVAGETVFQTSAEVRNGVDSESDFSLWSGLTTAQKESLTYKDWNGSSQWYMEKDQYNNWVLNSAVDNLDHFKAYQNGDDYIDAASGATVRVNYESGSGSGFAVYGGNSSTLYFSLTAANSVKIPGLAASSGHNCLQIDNSGWVTNTGSACGSGSTGGTVTSVGLTETDSSSYFTITSSPVTSSGNLGLRLTSVTGTGNQLVTSASPVINDLAMTGYAEIGGAPYASSPEFLIADTSAVVPMFIMPTYFGIVAPNSGAYDLMEFWQNGAIVFEMGMAGDITRGSWSGSPIQNVYLANSTIVINGTTCTLGSPCTVSTSTFSGTSLPSTVTGSYLTSVGTITTGVWQGTPIANAYLANSSTTVNGQPCALGGACTITASLSGTSLPSSVVTSYLTAVGTITTGVWQGTPVANAYLANSSVTVASQSCVLGSSCAIAAANLSNGTSGTGAVALVNAPTFTGNVTTHANNAASQDYLIIQPGTGGTDYIGALEFANYAGTSQWEIRKDASNTFRIRDTVNSVDRFIQYAGTQTEISSGGTSSVAINNTSSSGTGGFIVYEGGTNYNTIAFSVASNGNAAVTGTLTANATTITTTLTAATVKDTGVLSAYLIGSDSSGDLLAETMSGDATLGSGGALTLASVNGNPGSFGSSTAIPTFTVNAKGLITAAGSTAVIAPAGTLTGTALASTVVTSSLTTVGTIGTGVWQGTAIGVGYGGLNTATAPSAGQILIAQSATAYAPETASGDCTLSAAGAFTCLKSNGTAIGTGAFAIIANYATLASPTFTGTPSAPTQTTGDNTTALATDVFVNASITAGGFLTTSSASSTYATKASPIFTGTVTVPTETIVSSGNMHLDAATGAYYVCINCDNNTGTSGFVVQNGTGSSPTTEFQVTGSGNTTATGYLSSKGWFGNYTASYTAGAAAGTSPTIACATTHTCTNIQGTYSIKTGASPTTGTLVTINLNHTQNNILDCSSDLWLPGTGHILTYELTNSTTSTIVVTLDAALTASTTYYFTYVCGSY
jgi:hypothetical protein